MYNCVMYIKLCYNCARISTYMYAHFLVFSNFSSIGLCMVLFLQYASICVHMQPITTVMCLYVLGMHLITYITLVTCIYAIHIEVHVYR